MRSEASIPIVGIGSPTRKIYRFSVVPRRTLHTAQGVFPASVLGGHLLGVIDYQEVNGGLFSFEFEPELRLHRTDQCGTDWIGCGSGSAFRRDSPAPGRAAARRLLNKIQNHVVNCGEPGGVENWPAQTDR